MARSIRIPKYRKHSSGQVRVTINRQDHLLGEYGSAESKEAYQRLIAEWLASPSKQVGASTITHQLLIHELILHYWKFASS